MKAISVDLPWGPSGEAAAVTVGQTGKASWKVCDYPGGLLSWLEKERGALVLLDIPIHGMELPGGEHFRPIDKALQHVGISVRPSSSAKGRGKELANHISQHVLEIYPYATYKVLHYLVQRDCIAPLRDHASAVLLDSDFRERWPLPYKRRSGRGTRREGMNALHSTLTHPDFGLEFAPPLPTPNNGGFSLKRLSDIYDAALGAVLGLHLLSGSPWAAVKGDDQHGSMALLADQWLNGEIDSALARQ